MVDMGAVVNEGVVIEQNSVVAAGSVVAPGEHIPAGQVRASAVNVRLKDIVRVLLIATLHAHMLVVGLCVDFFFRFFYLYFLYFFAHYYLGRTAVVRHASQIRTRAERRRGGRTGQVR